MKARIATICQTGLSSNSVEGNRNGILRQLDLIARHKPDLICLPETFTTVSVETESKGELAEKVPGPTTDAVAQKAKANKCYIICPITTKRNSRIWNSALVIDRSGDILGIYDKVHPVTTSSDYTILEDGVTPGGDAPIFDLDFGRIGIQICFDLGFPESWERLAQKGAKMVVWPSAYNGGFPLQVYAYLHHYYVVSSVRSDRSKIINPCGRILAETDPHMNYIIRDINLDYIVSHYDFNYSVPDQILKAYPGRVKIWSYFDDAHFIVEPIDDALTAQQLQKEFGFESTFQYHQRHREAYSSILQSRPPPVQRAAHGDRPQYSKVE